MYLFVGLIMDNICYGCLDVIDEEVIIVVKVVFVYFFIKYLLN